MKRSNVPVAAAAMVWAGLSVAAGQAPPADTEKLDESRLAPPTPAKIAIWTDKPGYLRWRELISVYMTVDPRGDPHEYTEFVYLENIRTGHRQYMVREEARWSLRDAIVDSSGRGPGYFAWTGLSRLAQTRIWSGRALEPGLWQFVAELRSRDETEVVKRAHAKFVISEWIPAVTRARGIETEIATDTTWTNDRVRAVRHRVSVNAGATLTIEPGTLILARGPHAAIIVEKGGRIVAKGRPEAPIVMTCDEAVGQRFPGCWGGLIVLGGAPVAGGPAVAGGAVPETRSEFGGDDPEDSSGVLSYVRVEFAGAGATAETRTGGIRFHGVGAGTQIDHIQSHASAGDGIDFAGGTANCMHCVSSGAHGVGLRWTLGWRGAAQHVFVQQSPAVGGSGIEGGSDEHGGNPFRSARPMLYNLTVVGGSRFGTRGAAPSNGLVLKRGAGVLARNVTVTGFGGIAIDMANADPSLSPEQTRSIRNTIVHANGGGADPAQVNGSPEASVEFVESNPNLVNVRYEPNPDPRPRLGSPALMIGAAAVPPSTGFFDTSARYVGAFGDANWLEEWTFFGDESEYRPDAPNRAR